MTIPADATSDEQLIARTRDGDMAAYDELYRRHVDDASRVARIVTNNSDEAQDVVAEAFTRVLTRLREGGGPDAELAPYLRTVVRRLAIDRHRTSQRDGQPSDPSALDILPRADDPMARATDRQLVRHAFETLPERWQQVLWHTEIEGRSPASLAPALGSSPNAVAALAYRAREGLRQAYLAVNLSAEVQPECRPYAPKVASYARGTLSAHDTREMGVHLSECPHCRERRDEFLLLVSDLRGVLWPALLLPASGAAVAAVAGGAAAAGGGILAFLSPTNWGKQAKQVAATGAGVAAAGIIAASAYLLVNDDPPTPPVAAPTSSPVADDPEPDEPAGQLPDTPPDEPPAAGPAVPPVSEPPPSEAPEQPVATTEEPAPQPTLTPTASEPSPSETPSETPPVSPSPTPETPPAPDTPPVVDEQPPATPTVTAGEPLTLTVSVSGTPEPRLQWQYRDSIPAELEATTLETDPRPDTDPATGSRGDGGWTDIEGETSNTLVIPELTPDLDGRAYRVLATNEFGTTTTEPAVVSVEYAPDVTTQPIDVEVAEGGVASFSATAVANPAAMTVRWEYRAPDGDWMAAEASAIRTQGTTSSLDLTDVEAISNGYEYRAIFANTIGETATDAATLSVLWVPSVTVQPENVRARPGDDVEFAASADANPSAVSRWQSAPSADGPWTDVAGTISGPANAVLSVPDVMLDQSGTYYRAVFTNDLGEVTTDPARLSVVPAGLLQINLTNVDGPRCVVVDGETVRAGSCGSEPLWEVPGDGTIRWAADGRCLAAGLPLSPTSLHDCDDSANHQWSVDETTSSPQSIQSGAIPGHCLDIQGVEASGTLILFPCHNGDNQKFSFVSAPVTTTPTLLSQAFGRFRL